MSEQEVAEYRGDGFNAWFFRLTSENRFIARHVLTRDELAAWPWRAFTTKGRDDFSAATREKRVSEMMGRPMREARRLEVVERTPDELAERRRARCLEALAIQRMHPRFYDYYGRVLAAAGARAG